MALRRQRKQLTNVIYTVDRRLRNLEFMQIKGSTTTATEPYDNLVAQPPSIIPADTNPSPWCRIIGGYYYPASITSTASQGNTDRVDLYVTSDPGLAKGDSVTISGVRTTNVDVSKDSPYKVIGIGTSAGIAFPSGTPSWYVAPPAGTVNTVYYTSQQAYNAKTSIPAKALISSVSATNTAATVVFTGAHNFQAGDVIDVYDLGAVGTTYNEIDGHYKVASVTSNSLTYNFYTAKASSIPSTSPSGKYIYPVLNSTTNIGDTWIDTSQSPAVTYYWDGLRWVTLIGNITDGDGVKPGPPSNLSVTSEGYTTGNNPNGTPQSYSRATLTWTAPTVNEKGDPLKDLAGYDIQHKKSSLTGWSPSSMSAAETTAVINGLESNAYYDFRVYSVDAAGNRSTSPTERLNVLMGIAAQAFASISAPVLGAPRLGTITVTWDGKNATGAVIPSTLVREIQVHVSTTSGFTPSDATLKDKLYSSKDSVVLADLAYNTVYYVRFLGVDLSGNIVGPSAETASAKILPLVDADLIAAQLNSPLTAWPFKAGAVTAGALASGAIDASNMFAVNVIYQSAISANAIGANQIAAGAVVAGKLTANSVVAGNISALAVSAANLQANSVTADKITAGAVTAVKISAEAVTATKILATDTYTYRNAADTESVRIGGNTINAVGATNTPGVSVYQGPNLAGWFGAWGAGSIEMGTNFTLNYIDMYSSTNYTNITASGGLDLNANAQPLNIYGGSGVYLSGAIHIDTNLYFDSPRLTTSTSGRFPLYINPNVSNRVEYYDPASSRSVKTDIASVDTTGYLEYVADLNPVTFKYIEGYTNDTNKTELGLIAEELAEAKGFFSDLVEYDKNNNPKAIRYFDMQMNLLLAIKDAADRIIKLEKKVNDALGL